MQIEEHVPLAPLTTFRLGGSARFFSRVANTEELTEALSFGGERSLPVLILGGGSNLLVRDEGYPGLVIHLALPGVEWKEAGDSILVRAAAGESWDGVVESAVLKGFSGIENLSGIPGTVGAAPVQNIGAYGSELKDVLVSVEVLERSTRAVKTLTREECLFGYRTSVFKQNPHAYVVLAVTMCLSRTHVPTLAYKDLADAFSSGSAPSLAKVRTEVLRIRSRKFPDLSHEGTAGSFFLNPIVSTDVATRLQEMFSGIPQFSTDAGVKISLAWLLDKGLSIRQWHEGGARQFERQPIVLTASRNARAQDVEVLAARIAQEVKKHTDITLSYEVRVV